MGVNVALGHWTVWTNPRMMGDACLERQNMAPKRPRNRGRGTLDGIMTASSLLDIGAPRPPSTEASDDAPESFVDAFVQSMPPRYRAMFDAQAVRAHAAIAYRRTGLVVRAEVWRTLADGSVAVAIVADDRAGLLSLISAALVVHQLDVVAAQAYGRVLASGVREILDLFWVRRLPGLGAGPIDSSVIASASAVLRELIEGRVTVEAIARRAAAPRKDPDRASTLVRFEGDDKEGLAVLTVETVDRPGLLLAMCQALFRLRVQIVRSEVRTIDGRVFNRFEVAEFDGAPVRRVRRMQIQVEVLASLEQTRVAPGPIGEDEEG
jgi:[protein-PII] uridylyltransferase